MQRMWKDLSKSGDCELPCGEVGTSGVRGIYRGGESFHLVENDEDTADVALDRSGP